MDDLDTTLAGRRSFAQTRWSVVLRAKGENISSATKVSQVRRDALGKLIEIYWKPLYFFVRRKGHGADDARDLVQAFFATFLEKDFLKSVEREKGRFRTFLLVSMEHFLANEYDKARAQKRGGGRKIVSLDFDDAEQRYGREPSTKETPESLYLKKWAKALTDQAMAMLKEHFKRNGKAELFTAIRTHLAGGDDYEAEARKFKMTANHFKVTVHRARKLYREFLREAVRDTVRSDADVDDELKEIINCL